MADDIHAFVSEYLSRVAAAREKACEAAVQSGGYGVLETRFANGDITFELTAAVPYGCIHIKDVG
jgi:hypothetical protein